MLAIELFNHRSIPAYAGDPYATSQRLPSTGVYPRLRGGSFSLSRKGKVVSGLSPPTRGIQWDD